MKKLIFINSHPIQYFAPMYKYMDENGIDLKVWYCSDESLKERHDKQFNVAVKWDIPLLDGYQYEFFSNASWKPSHFNGFWGLINLSMIRQLFRQPKSVVAVHGWHYCTLLLVLLLGKLKGHKICLRCDVPLSHELLKAGFKQKIKRFLLRNILFPRINYFLYIGKENRLFYESYGISGERLVSCPYAVDNARFQAEANRLKELVPQIKQGLGIPYSGKVIVYSAKYISKKRPQDLLEAFNLIKTDNTWLIFVGEGELRPQMESYISQHALTNVILTGFVNQSKIAEYYAIADLFVMCSSLGENWGLSVNEAMNFDVPQVLSDLTGCSSDLVVEGENGYTFKTGDIHELSQKINFVLNDHKLSWKKTSREIIEDFSYQAITVNFKKILS